MSIVSTFPFKKNYRINRILTVFFSRLVGGGCCGVGTMIGGDGG